MTTGEIVTQRTHDAAAGADLEHRLTPPASGDAYRPTMVPAPRQLPVPAASAQKDGELVFEALQGLPGLERLASDWGELARSLAAMRFMHLPQWYRAYLGSRKSDPDLIWFVAAYRGGKLAAVFPLQFQHYQVRSLRPRLLGTVDDGEMQLSDFIFAQTADNRGLLKELIRWLRRQKLLAWDELRLRKVPADSAIAYAARACPHWATLTLRHDGSAYFDTSGSYEQATQSMAGAFRRNLRRLARRAEETDPLRHRSYRLPGELPSAFASFIDIEASGWKGAAGTSSAIGRQPAMLRFYSQLVGEFGPQGNCIVNLLWHGDTAVAGQFCLQIGRTLHVLKIGFSNAHAHFAPGNLLLDLVIRQACEDPAIDVVSLVNEPAWGRNFKPLITGLWSYNAPNWSVRGLLVHVGLLVKRLRDKRGRRWLVPVDGRKDDGRRQAAGNRRPLPPARHTNQMSDSAW